MKTRNPFKNMLALTGTLAMGLASLPAGEVPITNFDSDDISAWYWENWSAPGEFSHDATLDAGGGNPNGSLRLVNNFVNNPGGYQQCVFSLDLRGSVDAETFYSHISMDVKVDAGSTPRAGGDYGSFEIIFRDGAGWTWNGRISVALNGTDWIHVSAPVGAPASAVHHLTLKLGQNALLGPVTYNVDNITWTESTTPPSPPTLGVKPAKAGLNMLASGTGQYDRQNIRALDSSYGWVGVTDPVSYALTIADYPAAPAYQGFQTHIFLVPGTPGSESGPDWNEPNVVFIQIQNNADGSGTGVFRWKTNEPNGNSGYWGDKPYISSPSILGTWTVTFNQDTNVTMTAPNGASTNFTISAEMAALFAGDLKPYFGIQPNQGASIGQGAIFGKVKIASGSTVLLEDSFSGTELDTTVWQVNATSAAGIVLLTPEAAGYWVSWTLPDTGFVLQSSPTLRNPTWVDSTLTDAIGATSKHLHVPRDSLPGASQGFLRMVKP